VFVITFIRPVWTGLLAVNVGLVPGPALCPGAGAAERLQEILYSQLSDTLLKKKTKMKLILGIK
jgi:hypothetical protein